MRVFLTGASGYLGSVLTGHLVSAGHEVRALARSDAAADRVRGLGATAVPGSLTDIATLREAAADADAVIHAAVDFAEPAMGDLEQPAVEAMLQGLAPGAPFIYTSTGLVYPDRRGTLTGEDLPLEPGNSLQPFKVLGERQVLAAEGPAVTVIRAALIYGRGGSALLQGMIAGARERGAAPYVDDGANEWSSVHVDDLARLYLAVLARAGQRLVVNAASRDRTSMRQIAEAVAAITGAGTQPVPLEQARQLMGTFAEVLASSTPLDTSRAERELGWQSREPSLIQELTAGSYAAR